MLRCSGWHAPRVEEYTPVRLQLFLSLLREDFQTRERMLRNQPVEVSRIMDPKETIPHDKITVADFRLRSMCLEESRRPASPALTINVLHEMARGKTEIFPNAAAHEIRIHRA